MEWTPVSRTQIVFTQLTGANTTSHDIPTSAVPNTAKRVFVYVAITTHLTTPGGDFHIKIYTEKDSKKFAQYIYIRPMESGSTRVYNSDSMWFPIPTNNRKVYVESPDGFTHLYMWIYVIGYN